SPWLPQWLPKALWLQPSALRQRDSSAHWASNTHRAPLRLWWIWMQAVRWWPPVIPAQHGSFPAAKFMCPNVFGTQPNQRKGHQVIIDIHGHYTTAPEPLGAWRQQQLAALDGGQAPAKDGPVITDDQICESLEPNQLRLMDERGVDVQIFSPRASFMAHHAGDFETSSAWSRHCNDLIGRVAELYPQRFAPSAMLPQSPGVETTSVIDELERCVAEHDIVAVNLNPAPSGGNWTSPPLTDQYWFPVYEKLIEYELPVMVHVSTSINPAFHTTGAHYLNADTTAVMQLLQGDLFATFPQLNMIIPHGGGAAPYHWGRFRGLAMMLDKPELEDHLLNNIY